ncbi:LysM peptidoglycan-binding domain-containing protein [Enterococcus sp. DIV0385]|uniref:LysM peptidoglycan-binding domain-containing protein n=1 Tax=Enterococcus sp. DIV0385 TaxID=2775003 RepID=UPI000A33EC16|nr:hypothetical protein A5852_003486 [Enterococcus faecium]
MKMLKVLAIGITVGGMALAIHTEKAEAAEWTPRSSEQIKADISGNKYTVVWGDTLSAISEATNITVEKLAEWNSISNVDLIFAGNTISWDGNVATMENAQGDTISQAVIQETPADRVDPTKPIGGGTGSNTGNSGSGNTNNTTNPPATNDNGSGSGNGTVTPPAGGDNGSGDNGSTTPPTGGDNGSGGGGTDVTPPPGEDNGTGGGDNGSGGGETDPEEELYRVTPLGNSGMEFDTNIEAAEWGLAQTMDPESPWFGMRSTSKPLFWSNGEVLSYSVDFY